MLSIAIQKKIGKKFNKRPMRIPKMIQINAQYIKYIILFAVIILCFSGQQHFVDENSPWTVFSFLSSFHMPRGDVIVGSILLALIVAGMAVQERFFCQFVCPMGGVFSILPILPFGQFRRDREQCSKRCSVCAKACPAALELGEDPIRSGECIRCGKCTDICPKENISIGWLPLKGTEPAWVGLQAALLLLGLLLLKI